jgi:hypothetical protein
MYPRPFVGIYVRDNLTALYVGIGINSVKSKLLNYWPIS